MIIEKVYQVQFENGGKRFSHLFHTRWRAEKDAEDMKNQGCKNVTVTAYKAIEPEVI